MQRFLRLVLVAAIAAMALMSSAEARAALIQVSKVDGVIFSYNAVVTNGVLAVNFDSLEFATRINDTVVTPIQADFAPLTLMPTALTDDIPGVSGHFTPNLNTTRYGITSLSPPSAPNVVFDFSISLGQALANGLTMTGVVALNPASALSITVGSDTYDFSSFQSFSSFTLSLGTQAANPTLVYDVLKSGNGSFSGTGQFDQFSEVIPEPSSIVLMGIAGVLMVAARSRRLKA